MITNSVEEAILLADRIVPMTSGPRARLGEAVAVELARPRSPAQLMHDDDAAHVRAHVVARLTADRSRVTASRRISREPSEPFRAGRGA
jgi:nitrate/nitrite transport system ATP-binding protein